jgi:CRISPR system Cascade subunit CasC
MVADDPSLNADASAQVAHAISTHRVDIEYDYFTAVDDRAPEDNAGAGMIGTVEFDSATLYRYATVAVHELFGQLADNTEVTAHAMTEFTKAFVTSMPTGKQNTFANRTPADAVLLCIRTDQPINLVGAFEEAVKAKSDESGFVAQSIDKLSKYNSNVISTFVDAPMKSWCIGADIEGAEKLTDMTTLLASISDFVTQTFGSAASSEA